MGENGDGEVSLALIGTILKEMQAEQRAVRADLGMVRAEQRTHRDENKELREMIRDLHGIVVGQIEQGRRLDRHMTDLRDEIELTVRAELMGRLAVFETRVERRIDKLAAGIEEAGIPPVG